MANKNAEQEKKGKGKSPFEFLSFGLGGKKSPSTGPGENDDENNSNSDAAVIATKIENSQNIQKLVSRFAKADGNFRFLRGKRRNVTRDMYNRAYDNDRIWKVGMLSKQGGNIKTWKSRFFLLKQKIIFYFQSLEAYEKGEPPKGWIWIREMKPQKTGFVCTPTYAYSVFLKVNAFNISTPKRTFAICCKSKEHRLEWMKAIQEVYKSFWTGYGLPVPIFKAKNEDPHGTLEHLLPVAQKLDTYDDLEQQELEDKTRLLMLGQCFLRWKAFIQLERLEKQPIVVS